MVDRESLLLASLGATLCTLSFNKLRANSAFRERRDMVDLATSLLCPTVKPGKLGGLSDPPVWAITFALIKRCSSLRASCRASISAAISNSLCCNSCSATSSSKRACRSSCSACC